MNILILGHKGQIGEPLYRYLKNKGHTVIGWDKKNGLTEELTLPENWNKLVTDMAKVDKVIFLAFEVGGSKYLQNVDASFDYINSNVALMESVFTALRVTGKPFLFASSQMANMHHTNYGFLKDLGERYTRSLPNGWICRFWNVYGYESPEDPKSHVITDFLHTAQWGEINIKTDGSEERQFLHVDDCSRGIEGWIDNEWDDQSQYYDITSFKWDSIYRVAEIISTFSCGIKINKGNKADSLQRGIKNEPNRYILKFWEPLISLEEGIAKINTNE